MIEALAVSFDTCVASFGEIKLQHCGELSSQVHKATIILRNSMYSCFLTICAFAQLHEDRPAFVQDRLLIGNNDEITGLCWVGASSEPSHVVVASNSEHIRIFDAESLNCSTTMAGHTGTVLCLAIRQLEDRRALVLSGKLSCHMHPGPSCKPPSMVVKNGK